MTFLGETESTAGQFPVTSLSTIMHWNEVHLYVNTPAVLG